jgi:hypothetical protein
VVLPTYPSDASPSAKGNTTRDVHAYSSAPAVELLVNGKSFGVRNVTAMIKGPGSYAEWLAVPWEAGTVTAVAKDKDGKEVARASRTTNAKAAKLTLDMDVPSKFTGTGEALLLDGQVRVKPLVHACFTNHHNVFTGCGAARTWRCCALMLLLVSVLTYLPFGTRTWRCCAPPSWTRRAAPCTSPPTTSPSRSVARAVTHCHSHRLSPPTATLATHWSLDNWSPIQGRRPCSAHSARARTH